MSWTAVKIIAVVLGWPLVLSAATMLWLERRAFTPTRGHTGRLGRRTTAVVAVLVATALLIGWRPAETRTIDEVDHVGYYHSDMAELRDLRLERTESDRAHRQHCTSDRSNARGIPDCPI